MRLTKIMWAQEKGLGRCRRRRPERQKDKEGEWQGEGKEEVRGERRRQKVGGKEKEDTMLGGSWRDLGGMRGRSWGRIRTWLWPRYIVCMQVWNFQSTKQTLKIPLSSTKCLRNATAPGLQQGRAGSATGTQETGASLTSLLLFSQSASLRVTALWPSTPLPPPTQLPMISFNKYQILLIHFLKP